MSDSVKQKRTILRILALLGLLTLIVSNIILPSTSGRQVARIAVTKVEMENFIASVQQYRVEYGNLPAGDPINILKLLVGDNPRKIPFLHLLPRSLNTKGEWLDP